MKHEPNEIAGIKICNKLKHLAITINDSKNIFKVQKQLVMENAVKMAYITFSVVVKRNARLMIGKVY